MMTCTQLDSHEEEVRQAKVSEPSAAWIVLVTVMKTASASDCCVSRIMANYGKWPENILALVSEVRIVL